MKWRQLHAQHRVMTNHRSSCTILHVSSTPRNQSNAIERWKAATLCMSWQLTHWSIACSVFEVCLHPVVPLPAGYSTEAISYVTSLLQTQRFRRDDLWLSHSGDQILSSVASSLDPATLSLLQVCSLHSQQMLASCCHRLLLGQELSASAQPLVLLYGFGAAVCIYCTA